ncbi:MAG: hypothetical protein GF334_05880 [Candidatus Altiarchaeales archaeon]|nr:hypothetical protein [Candidatus Altiarchaeales archaeon]
MARVFQGVIRIDYLKRMLEGIRENRGLEEILGKLVDKHFALTSVTADSSLFQST